MIRCGNVLKRRKIDTFIREMDDGEGPAAAVQVEILSEDLYLTVDRRVCGDIKIVDLGSQHKIAHGAACDIRLVSAVDQLLSHFKRIRADAVSSEMVKLFRKISSAQPFC